MVLCALAALSASLGSAKQPASVYKTSFLLLIT
jgi:hypothetical protein